MTKGDSTLDHAHARGQQDWVEGKYHPGGASIAPFDNGRQNEINDAYVAGQKNAEQQAKEE